MKKLYLILSLFIMCNIVNAQDVYNCYKIEKGKYDVKTNSWTYTQFKDDIEMPIFIYHSKIRIRNKLYYIMSKEIVDKTEENIISVDMETMKRAKISIIHFYNNINELGMIQILVIDGSTSKKYYLNIN
jgi:hypothetical protein